MELETIKAVIKNHAIRTERIGFSLSILSKTDISASQYGPLTHNIARPLGLPLPKARYHLDKHARAGHLIKSATPGGISRWWYPGLLEELKREQP